MPRLTPTNWRKFEKFLLYVGCHLERERGDHRIYWRQDLKRPVVIPRDNIIPIFIIKNNLKVLGISAGEYLEVLKRI